MAKIEDIDLPLGIMDYSRFVRNPHPDLSRMVIGATGASKTTAASMTTVQGLMATTAITCWVNDVKQGEHFAQLVGVAEKTKRKLGVIDDCGVFGWDNPYRIKVNAFGSIISALHREPETLNFTIENATHAFVPEVDDGNRNFVFRERPRREIHLAIRSVAEMKPKLLTPGMVYEVMSDPQTWRNLREVAVEEGSPALQARARSSIDVQDRNPEDYHRHYEAAIAALSAYETGSVLNAAGGDAEITHEEISAGGWLICHVMPQVHAQRLAVHAALHHQSVMAAQFSGRGGVVRVIYDELCNSPAARKAIEAITVQRSYGLACDYIAQTFEDIERQFGKQLAATLADNCAVHQYLSFSDADAHKVSKLMGEEISIQRSMNINPQRLDVSGSMSMGKQPVMTPDQLKNLPPDYQVVFIRGYGWLVCRKLYQNQIGPTCHWLSPNPQEGGRRLPPDPKIKLPVAWGAQ